VTTVIYLAIAVWFGTVFSIAAIMTVNQFKLLRLYRRLINPPYPIAPGDKARQYSAHLPVSTQDPLGLSITWRFLRVAFEKYPDHLDLAKQARKVRLELAMVFAVAIIGFLAIVALIFIPLHQA
jgi:hypothetical protein